METFLISKNFMVINMNNLITSFSFLYTTEKESVMCNQEEYGNEILFKLLSTTLQSVTKYFAKFRKSAKLSKTKKL